jgi:hypothetical protein
MRLGLTSITGVAAAMLLLASPPLSRADSMAKSRRAAADAAQEEVGGTISADSSDYHRMRRSRHRYHSAVIFGDEPAPARRPVAARAAHDRLAGAAAGVAARAAMRRSGGVALAEMGARRMNALGGDSNGSGSVAIGSNSRAALCGRCGGGGLGGGLLRLAGGGLRLAGKLAVGSGRIVVGGAQLAGRALFGPTIPNGGAFLVNGGQVVNGLDGVVLNNGTGGQVPGLGGLLAGPQGTTVPGNQAGTGALTVIPNAAGTGALANALGGGGALPLNANTGVTVNPSGLISFNANSLANIDPNLVLAQQGGGLGGGLGLGGGGGRLRGAGRGLAGLVRLIQAFVGGGGLNNLVNLRGGNNRPGNNVANNPFGGGGVVGPRIDPSQNYLQ